MGGKCYLGGVIDNTSSAWRGASFFPGLILAIGASNGLGASIDVMVAIGYNQARAAARCNIGCGIVCQRVRVR